MSQYANLIICTFQFDLQELIKINYNAIRLLFVVLEANINLLLNNFLSHFLTNKYNLQFIY